MSLTASEANAASTAVSGEALAAVAARLYLANEGSGSWRLEHTGAAVIAAGRVTQVHLIDLRDRRSVFTVDVGGSDWKYNADRPYFHTFPSQRDRCYAALSFADETEANDFYSCLTDIASSVASGSRNSQSQGRTSIGSVNSAYQPPPQANPKPHQAPSLPQRSPQQSTSLALPPALNKSVSAPMGHAATPTIVDKKNVRDDSDIKRDSNVSTTTTTNSTGSGGGFFSFGRKKKDKDADASSTKKDKKKKSGTASGGKIDKSMISGPTNFEHVSHVGFNPNSGFTAQNIPMEWKAIFAKAGITEEQLADKKTAKFVQKFMKEHSGAAGMPAAAPPSTASNSRRAPPPPPPSRRQPPPPPPTRSSAPPAPSRNDPPAPPARYDPPPIPSRNDPPPPPARQAPLAPSRPDLPSYNSRSAAPSISAVAPPRPPPRSNDSDYSNYGSSAPPPPPPPPPMGGGLYIPSLFLIVANDAWIGIPPPPPPPGPGMPMPPPAPPRDSAPAVSAPRPPVGGGADKGDLLAAIRGAGGISALKQTPRNEPPPIAQSNSGAGGSSDDLAAALSAALAGRKGAMASDSEDSDDDGEDWDD
ncbi:hypothetical protein BDR26DRAFT_931861 [Obelidium mucronatum]|nr:hypothetical protein BDR26DRAFT_931861 [Obelidium mucronatum]